MSRAKDRKIARDFERRLERDDKKQERVIAQVPARKRLRKEGRQK